MKNLCLLMVLLSILFTTGCKSNIDKSIYGYTEGNIYINTNFNFSIDFPKNWIVNKDIGKLNPNNFPDDTSTILATIVSSSIEELTEGLDFSNIVIYSITDHNTLQSYANDLYEFDFGNENLNAKSISREIINKKDFIVVNYKNSKKYITTSNDIILVFDCMYSDKFKDEINSSI